jgi:hypothetical protein
MLLYAQPLTRILRLTIDDVLHQENEVSIRLGDPPSPVPEPFAGLLLRHIAQRLNLTTAATNPDARWLFPCRHGDQPMTPKPSRAAYASTESLASVAGPQRSGNSSCKHRRPLSPRCSVTTPTTPPG